MQGKLLCLLIRKDNFEREQRFRPHPFTTSILSTNLSHPRTTSKGQLLRELRKISFSGGLTDSAVKHISNVLEIASIFNAQESTLTQKLEGIHNFKQERDETLYHAWERYNDLLYQFPLHDLNYQQKVHIFYTGLDIPTRKILDSNGFIPLMTATQAIESIQVMADHSHDCELVEKGLTKVLFGRPSKEQIGLVEDRAKGTLWFKIVSDEDKKRGIHKPEKKIKGFYKGCLSLGDEYKYAQEVADWIRGCINDGMT
ncbi:hypothetical protein Tco_0610996 [Tanacetum coccineum]